MRGRESESEDKDANARITPAYAGKSPHARPGVSRAWDHPRVCGEKERKETEMKKYMGSPPRMRGKEPDLYLCRFSSGITPAYAGKRKQEKGKAVQLEDHPRVCGEKKLLKFTINSFPGTE